MLTPSVMGLARKMHGTVDRDAVLRAMDREELRRVFAEMNIVKVNYFGDGRKVYIKRRVFNNGTIYIIRCDNTITNFEWYDGVGYPILEECIATAEQMFGIKGWNAV